MEELKRSKFTAAGEFANERLIDAAAVAEHRPLAIVYPDGREIVAAPRGGALAFFEHLLTRKRKSNGERHEPVVPLPADYRVEIRDPRPLATA